MRSLAKGANFRVPARVLRRVGISTPKKRAEAVTPETLGLSTMHKETSGTMLDRTRPMAA